MRRLNFVFLVLWIVVAAYVVNRLVARALGDEISAIDVRYADGHTRSFVPATQPTTAPAPAPVDNRPVFVIAPGDPIPLGSDRRILFRAGQTYPIPTALGVGYSNLELAGEPGASGETRPILKRINVPAAPQWECIIQCAASTQNLTVRNLVLDSQAPEAQGAKPRGIAAAGRNLLIQNVGGRYLSDFINCELRPDGIVIKDCDCPLPKSIWGYGVWMDGSNITIDHFVFANSIREHAIRGRGRAIVIRNCDLANTFDPADPADFSKATIRLMDVEDALLEDDDCGPGDVQAGTNLNEEGVANNVRINRLRLRGGAVFHWGKEGGATNVWRDGVKLK